MRYDPCVAIIRQTAQVVLTTFLACASLIASGSSVSGTVTDHTGTPIPNARVFMEQGLGAPLVEVKSDRRGAFEFPIARPTVTGVFAYAPGKAFGGSSFPIAVAQDISGIEIRLREPALISGKVSAYGGEALEGARITRFAVRASTLSVPIAKLAAFGFAQVHTDRLGRFRLENVPPNSEVDLKVIHSRYAQQGVSGIQSGARDVDVTLLEGVLFTGTIVTRSTQTPVANANLVISKSTPPRDTVVTRTRSDGSFSVRLKPGTYLCRAMGATYRSPRGQRVVITGETRTQHAIFRVAGMGMVKGRVRDALTGDPVEQAKVELNVQGVLVEAATTGPTGEFQFPAVAGENSLAFRSAAGYASPPGGAITIVMREGAVFEHTFWIAAHPSYTLSVIDEEDRPVGGAIVTLLRPNDFQWRIADDQGQLTLTPGSIPSDGTVMGMVYHPRRREAALFSVDRVHAEKARVQVYPVTAVHGAVVDDRGRGIEGALVAAKLADGGPPEELVLWYTTTDRHGEFTWSGVVPHVPLVCSAAIRGKDEGAVYEGESAPFIISDDQERDVGRIVLTEAKSSQSWIGRNLKWHTNPVMCGDEANPRASKRMPVLVVYATPEEAPLFLANLALLEDFFDHARLNIALVASGEIACPDNDILVLRGESPGLPSTYLLDSKGRVVMETLGLPPIDALLELSEDAGR